ncbi:MAG: hypothetical protein MPK62_10180 [Alphaproteobacteria bacterium]|nr:hypothetical protein [Alphaproteobacteria bacterium]
MTDAAKANGIMLSVIDRHRKKESAWEGATFEYVKYISNTNKGNLGEQFAYEMFNLVFPEGEIVWKDHSRDDYDIMVNGIKFEVKTATQDKQGGFQFNGIRFDTKYDYLLLIGIGHDDLYFEAVSRSKLTDESMVPMAKGVNSSFKLTIKIRGERLHSINEFDHFMKNLVSKKGSK